MKVRVNGESVEVSEGALIVELLQELSISETRGLALAVNEQVVPKKTWESCRLQEEDEVLLITATQGG